jgi:hypothetical protein
MSIQCEQDVVKFQISVNDAVLVEIFQSQTNLGGVESITNVSLGFTINTFFLTY